MTDISLIIASSVLFQVRLQYAPVNGSVA